MGGVGGSFGWWSEAGQYAVASSPATSATTTGATGWRTPYARSSASRRCDVPASEAGAKGGRSRDRTCDRLVCKTRCSTAELYAPERWERTGQPTRAATAATKQSTTAGVSGHQRRCRNYSTPRRGSCHRERPETLLNYFTHRSHSGHVERRSAYSCEVAGVRHRVVHRPPHTPVAVDDERRAARAAAVARRRRRTPRRPRRAARSRRAAGTSSPSWLGERPQREHRVARDGQQLRRPRTVEARPARRAARASSLLQTRLNA